MRLEAPLRPLLAQRRPHQPQPGHEDRTAAANDGAQLRIPERSLLKKEDVVDFRRVKINYLENGGEEEMAKDAWLNSRPFGKIEEGEETFTRKFKPLDD